MKTDVVAEKIAAAPRKTPVIDTNRVTKQAHGMVWAEYFVRVPAGFVADDLKDPAAWVKVQSSGHGMRKFDRAMIVAFDESWFAEAIVASADGNGVVFAKPRVTTMPTRYDNLFQDDKYRVVWNGHGYVVERKADAHVMTQAVANPELAARELARLYPVRRG